MEILSLFISFLIVSVVGEVFNIIPKRSLSIYEYIVFIYWCK
jgi:hypothetical protein